MAGKDKAPAKKDDAKAAESESAVSPVSTKDVPRSEPYRIDKGEFPPQQENKNLNPDRAK